MHGLVLNDVARDVVPLPGEPDDAPATPRGEEAVDLHLAGLGPKLKRREISRLFEHDDRQRRQLDVVDGIQLMDRVDELVELDRPGACVLGTELGKNAEARRL